MSQAFRHTDILGIVRRDGKVTVEGLAAEFGVTLQTIRRDLAELADAGKLKRVHGGAVLTSGVVNIDYEERRALNAAAKAAIAARCAALIPNDSSVFLNIGTTTEAVAHALLRHRNLLVVTNNINVAQTLVANEECNVVVAGGTLRRTDGGLVGAATLRTVEQYKVDHAVIGCSALDEEGDLLDFEGQEVGVSQCILRQSRQSTLVADGTKLDRQAPVRIASLRDLDRLITDRPLPGPLADRCTAWGTEVDVVS